MSIEHSRTWVGWQGIIAEVPVDWSLGAIGGTEKTGYYRVDSGGSLALEVKWSAAGPQVDLYSKLDVFLNGMRRRARKRKLEFQHKIKSKDAGVYTFTWQADRKAQGRLWRCDVCDRVIIAQVSGLPSDNVSDPASWILPSICDHTEDGWRPWALYEVMAEVPPGYVLEKHRLMSGYIHLLFRKKNNRLVIERWGLANIALKNDSLKDWFVERTRHDLRPYRYTIENIEFEEESGIQISGRKAGIRQALKTAFSFATLRKPSTRIDGYAWVCEDSNKIFSIQSMHTPQEQILDQVLERVVCH